MMLKQMVSSTFEGVANTVQGVKGVADTVQQGVTRFAKLERVLAFVCLFIPAFLIWFDDEPIRGSISAYYNMNENQIFYFPLTVACMLFVVNGVVKGKQLYNVLLGVMLAGVILFNHHDFETFHNIFAVAFFAGNAVVIVAFPPWWGEIPPKEKMLFRRQLWFKALLVVIIAIAMLGYFLFGWLTLFWAEWFSFGIIALHYILESWGVID